MPAKKPKSETFEIHKVPPLPSVTTAMSEAVSESISENNDPPSANTTDLNITQGAAITKIPIQQDVLVSNLLDGNVITEEQNCSTLVIPTAGGYRDEGCGPVCDLTYDSTYSKLGDKLEDATRRIERLEMSMQRRQKF